MKIPVTAIFFPLFSTIILTGCEQVKGSMDKEKLLLNPNVIKVTVPTDKIPPTVKELKPESAPAAAGDVKSAAPSKDAPQVEEKLLPQHVSPESSQGIMPVPAPAPAPPKSNALSPTSFAIPSEPRLCSIKGPDLFYQGGTITEDTTWSGEVLVEGGVTVAPQTTLTVAPGTVVRFRRAASTAGADAVLLVQGRLLVSGAHDNPVRFTSDKDRVSAGDWTGIMLIASEKKNILENCRIEGAETGLDASFSNLTVKETSFLKCRTGLRLQDTLAAIAGGGALDCDLGFNLFDSEVEMRDVQYSGNRQGGVLFRSSLYLGSSVFRGNVFDAIIAKDSRLKLYASAFINNSRGITLLSSEGGITSCRISGNHDYGLTLNNSRVRVNGNEIERNGRTGIHAEDGKAVVWGNSICENGQYDLYNAGAEELKAVGNWWGAVNGAEPPRKIFDKARNPASGRVMYIPILRAKPELPLLKAVAK